VVKTSRAPYSAKKPKVVYEDTPTRGIPDAEPEPEPTPPPETEATRGGIVAQPKENLPEAHLGQYHDPADRFKPREPPPQKPVIVGRSAPEQAEPRETASEPTTHRLTEAAGVKPGDWGNIGLKNPFSDAAASGKPEATRFKVEPIRRKK